MSSTIRAAVAFGAGEPLQLRELDLASPGPREVRIRMRATGLCHSDLHFIQGLAAHYLPAVFGHEGMGEVVEIGSEVTQVAVGDTVIPYLVPDCGECDWCRSGLTNRCRRIRADWSVLEPSPLSLDGVPIANGLGTATFAEETVVPEIQVVKVDPRADPRYACCLACGVSTGIGAVLKTADVRPGSSVVVFGLGGVGLSAIEGARLAGASLIIGVDVNESKREVAQRLGATHYLDARSETLVEDVREITGGGAAYVFDCVGRAAVYRQAVAMLNRGWGVVVGVGMAPISDKLELSPAELAGIVLKRTFQGDAKRADIARYVDWYVEGRIQLDDIVTHVIPFDRINEGFELMTSGQSVRVVVDFDA
jgi:S-(hydroxymethyl)glutathione dehydrogenase / alcohol dehydrogenase